MDIYPDNDQTLNPKAILNVAKQLANIQFQNLVPAGVHRRGVHSLLT